MRSVKTLVDECAELCGSRAALARRLDVGRASVTNWASGHEPIPAHALARLCDMLQLPGDEARQILARAECENPRNRAHRDLMMRAFFVSWALGATLTVHPGARTSIDSLMIVARQLRELLSGRPAAPVAGL